MLLHMLWYFISSDHMTEFRPIELNEKMLVMSRH